jgi:hypothetical protein
MIVILSSINQPLHLRLVPLGSLFYLIRLFRLLAITVSACSDILLAPCTWLSRGTAR